MERNPNLNVPLSDVMRPELALSLQHVLHLYTVGNFLRAWKSPRQKMSIEQIFDSPGQARHAAQVCATWVGVPFVPSPLHVNAWWNDVDRAA